MDVVKYPDGAIKVLDRGFVKLVDHMGDDSSIVEAARVSYGKGTKTVNEDRGLIRYLLRHAHTTPFEMVEFKFHCKMPIFVARQWIRHRTWSFNEISGRYSEMRDEFYIPDSNKITKQSTSNKQGGSDEIMEFAGTEVGLFEIEQKQAYKEYLGRIERGMRKELARINLPLSLYTEWYCKVDLHNLFHFLKLRLDSHAQYEIRVFGEAIAELVKPIIPIAWEAFEDYVLNSVKLSRKEVQELSGLLEHYRNHPEGLNKDWQTIFGNKREAEEFRQKLERLIR